METQKKSPLFYGWVIAFAAFIIVVIGYGMRYGFSVFYVYILGEFGWTRANTALAFSLHLIVYGFSAFAIGYLVDKLGPRRVVPLGAIVLALGLLGLSQTKQIWHLYLFFGIVAGFGISALGNASLIPVISNWFIRKRGAAIGIYFAGVAGAPAIAPLVEYIISWVGWRQAYMVLAVGPIAIILPIAVFIIRNRPQDKGLLPDGDIEVDKANLPDGTANSLTDSLIVNQEWVKRSWTVPQAMKTRQFWALFSLNVFIGVQINMLYLHQVAHVVDMGFTQVLAASILGIVGLANIAGNLCGFISDRIGRERTYTAAVLLAAVAIYILISIHDPKQPWMLYAYAILFGLGQGISVPAAISSHADIWAGKNFGAINGLFLTGFGIGGFLGPFVGGWVFDVFHAYTSAFYLTFALAFADIAMIWLAAPRKIRLVAGMASRVRLDNTPE
ncbi:MFS transporter [Chloroflexota bacterium]